MRLLKPALVSLTILSSVLVTHDRLAAGEKKTTLSAKERARIELGRRLFFDPLVSRSGARACASCHDPEHGFSDPAPRSRDDMGLTRRHSQTIVDGALNPNAHWDGEFESLEVLITARLKPVSNGKGLLSHGASMGDIDTSGARVPGESGATEPNTPAAPNTGGTTEQAPTEEPDKPRDGEYDGGERRPSGENPRAPASAGEARPTTPPATPTAPAAEKGPEAAQPEAKPAEGPAKDAPPGGAQPPAGDPAAKPPEESAKEPQVPEATMGAPGDGVTIADLRKMARVDAQVEHGGRYREAFQAAYGSPAVNVARIADAIACYCRTIETTPSRYDRFAAGEHEALSAEERRGLELFRGRADCASCHTLQPAADGRVMFTDFGFHNTGVAWDRFAREGQAQSLHGVLSMDRGRERVTTRREDRRAFKTPSLRDVAERGPWFHDGSVATLEDAVRYYAHGGSRDPEKSPKIRSLTLTDEEVRALVSFLRALSGEQRAGLAPEAWARRAGKTTLAFVDARGRRMPRLAVRLVPTGDRLPGWIADADAPRALVTDERGEIAYVPPPRTHVRIELPEGVAPVAGALVPDTCEQAKVTVPVDGRLRLVLDAPASLELPPALLAEHEGVRVLPGHERPATRFERLTTFDGHDGRKLTVYAGWRRTDVPSAVRVRLSARPDAKPLAADLAAELTTLRVP